MISPSKTQQLPWIVQCDQVGPATSFTQTATGAEYNTELMTSFVEALDDLKQTWPGIETEDPLALGAGATQVSY